VIYAGKAKPPASEAQWVALVQATAAGDEASLHALYERAHRPVYTLIVRIVANREAAEELTLNVFHDLWRRAAHYGAAGATVLGWIMNQARSHALDRLRFDRRKNRVQPHAGNPLVVIEAADPDHIVALWKRSRALHSALGALTPEERTTIETAFFGELTHAEAAVRLNTPLGPIKTRIRSGLNKLRHALAGGADAMNSHLDANHCPKSAQVCAYAIQALPASEVAALEAHVESCSRCQHELDTLRPVVDSFVSWPTDLLRPSASLQTRLARRIAAEKGTDPVMPPARQWSEPEWEEVAPGISCKLLASDIEKHRVSMLVRLMPDVAYPAHVHAEFEELHLLDGELWIDGRKLYPGDSNRADAPTRDTHVWSETGCTCVLITSTRDILI